MRTKWSLAALIGVSLLLGRSDGIAQQQTQSVAQNAQGNEDAAWQHFSSTDTARIVRGFQIAPVPLHLRGKNVQLVGLGSYIVNAQGGCNDCHTSPPDANGGDPFAGERKKVNAARYLGGRYTLWGPHESRYAGLAQSHAPRQQRSSRQPDVGAISVGAPNGRRPEASPALCALGGSRPPPGHAVARLPGHDRSRSARDLPVLARDSVVAVESVGGLERCARKWADEAFSWRSCSA